jgi:phospholipid transport system substrate-binding protein
MRYRTWVAVFGLGAFAALSTSPGYSAAAAAGSAADASTDAVAATVDASDPAKLVQSAASAMLKDLDTHRAEYKASPSKVHQLVDQVLLPHFDSDYSARLVLGRHWNEANDDQRKRFINAFYRSLLNNYGDALVDFTADKLKVLPFTGDANVKDATVRTTVRKSDGTTVAVDYRLHRTDAGWKAWDVVIEGISYVKSFRDDFDTEIGQKGMDEVIKRLESGDTPAAIKGASGGKKG